MHYSIFVEDKRGKKIVVGEGFKGDGEASAAIRLIARELGLPTSDGLEEDRAADDFDALAADR